VNTSSQNPEREAETLRRLEEQQALLAELEEQMASIGNIDEERKSHLEAVLAL
jgi:hypothetical protein